MTNEPVVKGHSFLFLINSLYGGGAEKVCCILASEMAKNNRVTVVYLSENKDNRSYPLHPDVEKIYLPLPACSFRKNPLKWAAVKYNLVRAVRRIKKERQVDVSVSLLITPNLLNVFSRRKERVITSERANPRIYESKKFWQTRLAYALSDHVVFQSRKIQNLYGHRIRSHSSIIMNPVSVSCHAAQSRRKRIVSAGRLAAQKNYEMLISAFAPFHERFPDYTLTIYGEGKEREALENRIAALGLTDAVFLPGNEIHLHEKIADAEIFVLSSNFEGLSNALLESMTMGIACISTKCEGSTDVIRDSENGLLVDIGDEKALTDALIKLTSDPEFRNRLETQAQADAAAFDKDVVIKSWERVFLGS